MGERVHTATGSAASAGVRRLAAAVAAGALSGLLVAGLGGRLAMLVLRLTSDPNLHGVQTDDGFTIGIVSGATAFLLAATTVIGALGGGAYLVVRSWLPARARPWLFGALCGLVAGARIVRTDGVDFALLDPLALAIAMFVAIPAGYGVVTSLLAERLLADASTFRRFRTVLVPVLVVVPFVIVLQGATGLHPLLRIGVVAGAITLLAFGYRWPALGRLWASRAVVWLGRAALLGMAATSAVELVRDTRTIV